MSNNPSKRTVLHKKCIPKFFNGELIHSDKFLPLAVGKILTSAIFLEQNGKMFLDLYFSVDGKGNENVGDDKVIRYVIPYNGKCHKKHE